MSLGKDPLISTPAGAASLEPAAGDITRQRSRIWSLLPQAALIFLITFAAYYPVRSAGFIWDDDNYVEQNRELRTVEGLRRIWFVWKATPQYYPLVHSSFWVQYHLWGLKPLGYHLVNVFLQAANGCLLWIILRRLKIPGAWLAGAIFAVHPVHVESVAWITEHKNVLSGFFYLASIWASLRFLRLDEEPAEPAPVTAAGKSSFRLGWYVLGLVLFVAALLCKTVTCSLPAALLLLVYWRRGRIAWREVLVLIPWFAAGIASGLLTAVLERDHVGAFGADFAFSIAERCLIAGRAVWFYAYKLAFPWHLAFFYEYWKLDAGVWWQWLFPIIALALPISLLAMRKRWGRGPLVAVLFFGGTLFPALGFLNVYPMRYSFVADHFQYHASLGLIVLFAAGLSRLFLRRSSELRECSWEGNRTSCPAMSPIWKPAQGILLLVLMSLTFQQAWIYENVEVLWRDTISKSPDCWMAYSNLGGILMEQRQAAQQRGAGKQERQLLLQAREKYEAALRYKPDNFDALNNLGVVLKDLGEVREAERRYRQVVELEPQHANTWLNLGELLVEQNRLDEALTAFRKAAFYAHGQSDKHQYLELISVIKIGNTHVKRGDLPKARKAYERALQLDPGSTNARANLASTLLQSGEPAKALQEYDLLLNSQHGSAGSGLKSHIGVRILADTQSDRLVLERIHFGRALALHDLHRDAEALAEYQGLVDRLPADSPMAAEARARWQQLQPRKPQSSPP
jgi:tetratricopeptide (TPR) repeat protein